MLGVKEAINRSLRYARADQVECDEHPSILRNRCSRVGEMLQKIPERWEVLKANAVMLAGDITGKMIVPIVKQPDGTYLSSYAGSDIRCKSESEVQDLEKSIRDSGYYPYLTEPNEMASLEADKNKVNQLFTKLMVDTVVRWVQMA